MSIRDRTSVVLDKIIFSDNTQKSTTISIPFPNTLYIDIENTQDDTFVQIESMFLSGLAIPKHIIDQIFYFTKLESSDTTVITSWVGNGVVKIDFFAADYVQYHLLYGNKISKL